MKTNYSLLIFNFVISIFMLFSLNSFITSSQYLPALFLYFLSAMASFADKFISYEQENLFIEKWISGFCFIASTSILCLYSFDSLGFVKITFQNSCGRYHMLLQGMPEAFFSFNSIDITTIIFLFAATTPLSYMLFALLSALRNFGLTRYKIILIIKNSMKSFILLISLSFIFGILSVCFCHYKYQTTYEGFGTPQYLRYFFVFFTLSLTVLFIAFLYINRNKEYPQKITTNQKQK